LRKSYLFYFISVMLIVSCFSAPKNREQGRREGTALSGVSDIYDSAGAQEEAAVSQIMREGFSLSGGRMNNEPEEPELAEAVVEEEKPAVEYVETLSLLDESDPAEIAQEPDLPPTGIVMETLRPGEPASPSEPASRPPLPALPEQRTTQPVPPDFSPPVRESWPSLPPQPERKGAEPSIVQEPPPVVEEFPEERILQPDYPITFSRVARATVGQLVEIPFRGRDWVFIGEIGARRGIAYDSRKIDPEGESFIFRVDAAGVYALKFYRQDFAHDLILNDHVQIIAGGAPETTGLAWFNPPIDRSRVIAGPRWPNFLEQPPEVAVQPSAEAVNTPPVAVQPAVEAVKPPPPAAPPAVQPPARQPSTARNETARPQGLTGGNAIAQSSPAQTQTPSQPPVPPPAAEPKSPDSILKEAREEFSAGRIASAITLLDEFRKSFPSGSDEAWWLYGQCYEANSPNRNILAALDYYRRLVREYPQSSRLSDARRRISYLERYYINIQ
jgi:hypothetical protein